jgi:CheY-like chemotaxis protein
MPEVLFVEDDERLRTLYTEILQEAGFTVVPRALAEEALGYLSHHRPDVILLDLGMPMGRMNGLELLARLRENIAWASIPVVVVSGFGDAVNPDVIARLGVRRVLCKGALHPDEVTRAVREVVGS